MMKMWRILTAAAALAVFAAGCETVEDGDGSAKTEKRSSAADKDSGRKSGAKRRRDPRDDMFFGLGGAKAESFSNQNLSPREQKLLDEELRRQDDEMREMRRRHRDMDSGRSKRQEWVYGFKPLGSGK